MWIMQNGSLLEVPDDLPMPPNSSVIEPPAEFLRNPQDFRLEKGTLIHAPRKPVEDEPRLTAKEILQIRESLKQGLFKAVAETPDRRQGRRKEEK
jgi:hypothetical protein